MRYPRLEPGDSSIFVRAMAVAGRIMARAPWIANGIDNAYRTYQAFAGTANVAAFDCYCSHVHGELCDDCTQGRCDQCMPF